MTALCGSLHEEVGPKRFPRNAYLLFDANRILGEHAAIAIHERARQRLPQINLLRQFSRSDAVQLDVAIQRLAALSFCFPSGH